MRCLGVLLVAGSLLGCVDDRELWKPEVKQWRAEYFEDRPVATHRMDILYVVDNSALMAPNRARLGQAMETGGNFLVGGQGFWNDLHIGVVTADVDCDGANEPSDAVSWQTDPALTSSRFLIDWRHLDTSRSSNIGSGENLGPVLSRMATSGAQGCGVSRPFDAVRRAIADPSFRRPGADLYVGIFTAADDASTLSPADFVHDLIVATADQQRVFVGMAGPATVQTQQRFASVWQQLPNRSFVTTIDGSLDEAAIAGLQSWGDWGGAPCVQNKLVDLEPKDSRTSAELLVPRRNARPGHKRDRLRPPVARMQRHEQAMLAVRGRRGELRIRADLMLHIDRPDFPAEGVHSAGECEAEIVDEP